MKRERGEQSKENRKGLRGLTVACKYSHLTLGESPKISVCNSSRKIPYRWLQSAPNSGIASEWLFYSTSSIISIIFRSERNLRSCEVTNQLQIKPRKNSEAPKGFDSDLIWIFFLGFICNCSSYFTISFTSIFYPQFTHDLYHIHLSIIFVNCWEPFGIDVWPSLKVFLWPNESILQGLHCRRRQILRDNQRKPTPEVSGRFGITPSVPVVTQNQITEEGLEPSG